MLRTSPPSSPIIRSREAPVAVAVAVAGGGGSGAGGVNRHQQQRRSSGPSKPNFQKLLQLSGKSREEVAAKLGLDERSMHNLLNHRVTAVERWAPVFAKCVLLSRRGLLKLLRYEECEDVQAPSVGETAYQCLLRRGEETLRQCKEALLQGWAGWESYRLSPQELEAFFSGNCKEAEQVADFLLKLGQATDITNLFSMFTR